MTTVLPAAHSDAPDRDIDPLALERQVCFALAVTNRAVLAVYRPLLEPLGLTHPQYLVMLALWDNAKAGGDDVQNDYVQNDDVQKDDVQNKAALSVKQIAALLQMDPATSSPMLKRLEALGLVTRTRSAADERAILVSLTAEGEALRQRALDIPATVVARLGVEMSELEHLHSVLTRINTAAVAAGALDQIAGPNRSSASLMT